MLLPPASIQISWPHYKWQHFVIPAFWAQVQICCCHSEVQEGKHCQGQGLLWHALQAKTHAWRRGRRSQHRWGGWGGLKLPPPWPNHLPPSVKSSIPTWRSRTPLMWLTCLVAQVKPRSHPHKPHRRVSGNVIWTCHNWLWTLMSLHGGMTTKVISLPFHRRPTNFWQFQLAQPVLSAFPTRHAGRNFDKSQKGTNEEHFRDLLFAINLRPWRNFFPMC